MGKFLIWKINKFWCNFESFSTKNLKIPAKTPTKSRNFFKVSFNTWNFIKNFHKISKFYQKFTQYFEISLKIPTISWFSIKKTKFPKKIPTKNRIFIRKPNFPKIFIKNSQAKRKSIKTVQNSHPLRKNPNGQPEEGHFNNSNESFC